MKNVLTFRLTQTIFPALNVLFFTVSEFQAKLLVITGRFFTGIKTRVASLTPE